MGALQVVSPKPVHEIAMLEQHLRGLAALLHDGWNESDDLSVLSGQVHGLSEIAVVRYHYGTLVGIEPGVVEKVNGRLGPTGES